MDSQAKQVIATEQKPHSRLGLFSFALSLLAPLLYYSSTIFLFNEPFVSEKAFISLFILATLIQMTTLPLGVVGLFQRKKRKVFALLGIFISVVFILFLLVFLKMLLKGFRIPGI